MADTRISSGAPLPKAAPAKAPAKPAAADSTATPRVAGDTLKTSGPDQTAEALKVAEEALKLPPKPKKADEQKAWMMDGYARMLKAEIALGKAQRGANFDKYSALRQKLWAAEDTLAKADKGGAVKKEFFAGVLPPAKEMIEGLKTFPAPPVGVVGKAEWIAEAKEALAKAKGADELMKTAWFTFQAVGFDERSSYTRQLWDFERAIRDEEYKLNPPLPRPAQPGGTPSGNQPLFGLTQGAADLANSKNPVGQVAGAIALPIAITVDVLDLLTRLSGGGQPPKK